MRIISCEQNSPEWKAARVGKITASCFSDVLAKGEGKTRKTYMLKLAGERITGEVAESYSNGHMERGHEAEVVARGIYHERTGNEVVETGFMLEEPYGYSPDGLVGEEGLVEFKSRLPHLQAAVLLSGKMPPEHAAQVQGGLFVSGRKWVDFCSFSSGMPLFLQRVERDEPYIENLKVELAKFEAELQEVIKQICAMF